MVSNERQLCQLQWYIVKSATEIMALLRKLFIIITGSFIVRLNKVDGRFCSLKDEAMTDTPGKNFIDLTANIVSAYVSNNTLATGQLADVIQSVYNSLRGLEGGISEP